VKKNILYFCSVSKLDSGMPLSTLRLVKIFKDDYNVMVTLSEKGEMSEELDKIGVKYKILNFRRLKEFRNLKEFILFLFQIIPAQWRLFRLIKTNKIQVVHFSDIIDLPFFATAKISGAKVVSHLRVILNGKTFIKKLYLFLIRNFVDRVICVSNAVKDEMFSSIDEWEKVNVVHNPAPEIVETQCIASLSLLNVVKNDKNFKVCYISKFVKVKGHKNLLEVAKIIRDSGIKDISYYIIGGQEEGHKDYFESFISKMKEYSLSNAIKLVGKLTHNQTIAILNECDILVHLPDYQEPFPRVIMEAFALGKPVIAYKCGGIPELLQDGKNGFLTSVGDFDSIAKKIIEFKADKEKMICMGQFAREFLYEKFDEKLFRNKIVTIYEELFKI